MDYWLSSDRIVLPREIYRGAVHVHEGKIAEITSSVPSSAQHVISLGSHALMPALVDTHAHINEPGRTDWEGFQTATRAAAAGGIGTVIDMPLNSIPATTTVKALSEKRKSAEGQCAIDYGFWGGVVPGNSSELPGMIDSGILGFKSFLLPSGVDEFPHVTLAELEPALAVLKKRGVPLLVHAELESPVESKTFPPQSYQGYLHSRPCRWENEAIHQLINLARKTGAKIHVVHLSSAEALPSLQKAQAEGISISAETCPHYLLLDSEHIPDGATEYKCAPPIREKRNQDLLWEGLKKNTIRFVVSDHSPCTPELKRKATGDFLGAWGGIASLQLGLSLLWQAAHQRHFTLGDLSRWMSEETAKFAGLGHRKGQIAVGFDADLIVFDTEPVYKITSEIILHRHKTCPYLNFSAKGRVLKTLVRGETVYDDGKFSAKPLGKAVK